MGEPLALEGELRHGLFPAVPVRQAQGRLCWTEFGNDVLNTRSTHAAGKGKAALSG